MIKWGRKSSIWPMPFGTACCAIEFMAVSFSHYDIARFGAEVLRLSPRRARWAGSTRAGTRAPAASPTANANRRTWPADQSSSTITPIPYLSPTASPHGAARVMKKYSGVSGTTSPRTQIHARRVVVPGGKSRSS